MNRTFFAYHLTHHFGPFSLHSYHTNNATVREGDQVYVVSGDEAADGGKDYTLEGLFRIRRRFDGPFELLNLKGQPASFRFKLSMAAVRVPDAPIALTRADWYDRQEVHRFFSSGQNFNPLPTSPDYRARFDALLAGYGQSSAAALADDLADIARTAVEATQREALIQARIGQGRFRAEVVELWGKGEVCALTGIALPELLIASHIKPWRESSDLERLDPANGLLLATHADKLFDRHLLSFDLQHGDLRTVIAPIALSDAARLGLRPGMPLRAAQLPPSAARRLEAYMRDHHDRFQQRKAHLAASA
ncbi:HNH endonuclease [Xenophilus azovorans]|uniref:HNH endonuclease n=1 Tax=Xenophilus azovorans TaxID=151755 RepID=UPI00068E38BC|nr:HNH endonuclease signature motif containing protein [Xenophilus azovorans]